MRIRTAYRLGASPGGGMPRTLGQAMHELCATVDLVVVVGDLEGPEPCRIAEAARGRGCPARQVACAAQLRGEWFQGVERVGVAAPEEAREAMREVVAALERLSTEEGAA